MVDIISFEERKLKREEEKNNNYFTKDFYFYKCGECGNIKKYPYEISNPTCLGKDILRHSKKFMVRIDTEEERKIRRSKFR